MTCLAVIGVPRTAYTLTEAVLQARLRGLDVVLVDDPAVLARAPATVPVSRAIAVDTMSAPVVAEVLRPLAPTYVLSFTELHLVLAARVRSELGLPGVPAAVEERVRNKAATRACLRDRGLSATAFTVTTLAELESVAKNFRTPFVIKPLDLTGSIGVRAVDSPGEAAEYVDLLVDPAREDERNRELLVEEFIAGEEFSVEGLCLNGRFHLLAVTRKETTGHPYYHETGHLLPVVEADHRRFAGYVEDVTRALGIGTAPIHAEVKVTADAIELVEIHTRYGGDLIPLLIEHAFDVKPFGLFYDALLYGQPPPAPLHPRRIAGIRFLPAGSRPSLPVPGKGAIVTAELTEGSGTDPDALDNFRMMHRRGGHVLVTAPDEETVARLLAEVSTERQ